MGVLKEIFGQRIEIEGGHLDLMVGDPLPKIAPVVKSLQDMYADLDSKLKHYPGGEDHDQEQHGNWATGTVGSDGSGAKEPGPRKEGRRDRIRKEILAAASEIKFAEDKEADFSELSIEEIKNMMLPSDRSQIEFSLRSEWEERGAEAYSKTLDADDVANAAGWTHEWIAEQAKEHLTTELVDDPELLEQQIILVDKWLANGTSKVGDKAVLELSHTLAPEISLNVLELQAAADIETTIREGRDGFLESFKLDEDYVKETWQDWARNNPEHFPTAGIEDHTWTPGDDDSRVLRFAISTGKQYEITVFENGKSAVPDVPGVSVQFAQRNAFGHDRFGMAGTGGAHEVFSNVVPAITAYIDKEKPDSLSFTATETSRRRLYDKMITSLSMVFPEYMAVARTIDDDSERQYAIILRKHKDGLEKIAKENDATFETLVKSMSAFSLWRSGMFASILKHYPGGQDHDQDNHGNRHPAATHDILEGPDRKTKQNKPSIVQVAKELQDRHGKKINTKSAKGISDADMEYIVSALTEDVLAAYKKDINGANWYSRDIEQTMALLIEKYPELKDPKNQFALRASMAILSNGADIHKNMQSAVGLYEYWKKNGTFVTDHKFGNQTAAFRIQANLLQAIIGKIGLDQTISLFDRQLLRSDLEDLGIEMMPDRVERVYGKSGNEKKPVSPFQVSGENLGEKIPAFSIFGPKIGSFYNNLNGRFDTVTMDRWFMRTLGRVTGELYVPRPDIASKQAGELLSIVNKGITKEQLSGFTKKEIVSGLKQTVKTGELSEDNKAWQWAKARTKAYGESENETGGGFGDKSPVNVKANSYKKLLTELSSKAPAGGAHRRNIRAIMAGVQTRVRANGYPDTELAELQAVLWFHEKRLYRHMGARVDENEATDSFSSAARAILDGSLKPAFDAEKNKWIKISPPKKAKKKSESPPSLDRTNRMPMTNGSVRSMTMRSTKWLTESSRFSKGSTSGTDCGANAPGGGGFQVGNDCAAEDGSSDTSSSKPTSQKLKTPKASMRKNLDEWMKKTGLNPEDKWTKEKGTASLPPADVIKAIADEQLESTGPPDEATRKSYEVFKTHLVEQYQVVLDSGIHVYAWEGEGEPYKVSEDKPWSPSSDLMRKRIEEESVFHFFMTEKGFGDSGAKEGDEKTIDHPLMKMSPVKTSDGKPMLYNDVFRVVHDMVAHLNGGFSFSTQGEMNAMIAHATTLPKEARSALFAETFAQNSYYDIHKKFAAQNAYTSKHVGLIDELMKNMKKKSMVVDSEDPDGPLGFGRIKRQPWGRVKAKHYPGGEDHDQDNHGNRGGSEVANRQTGRQTDTAEFKKWFGNSKVVDADGKPLVVYHGGRPNTTAFKDPDGYYKTGIFFTSDQRVADAFGGNGRGAVYDVYLSVANPFVVDAKGAYYSDIERPSQLDGWATTDTVETDLLAEWAFKNGHDGVIVNNVHEGRGDRISTVFIVAKGTQIKSASGNQGTFDPNEPDIRKSLRKHYPGGEDHDQDNHGNRQTGRQTDTAEFKKWFGDSKVVDENGDPLVVYHGTKSDFTAFRMDPGTTTPPLMRRNVVYFTDNPDVAHTFAGKDEGASIMPVFLKLENPYVYDADGRSYQAVFPDVIDKAVKRGHDGVIVKNIRDMGAWRMGDVLSGDLESDIYLAFDPNQIKSASGNRGTFDPNEPDIRKSLRKHYPGGEDHDQSLHGNWATGKGFGRAVISDDRVKEIEEKVVRLIESKKKLTADADAVSDEMQKVFDKMMAEGKTEDDWHTSPERVALNEQLNTAWRAVTNSTDEIDQAGKELQGMRVEHVPHGDTFNRDLINETLGVKPDGSPLSYDELVAKHGQERVSEVFKQARDAEHEWKRKIGYDLSMGHYTIADLEQKDYHETTGYKWAPLPETMYHVTTGAGRVAVEGLKSRDELAQAMGVGLGGGESDTISFTHDPKIALDVYGAMMEAQSVAAGTTTVKDMIDMSTAGADASKPYVEKFVQYWDSHWKQGDPLPKEVVKAIETNDQDERFDAFKKYLYAREKSGGPENPVFFLTDVKALAQVDPEDIQVVTVASKPGSQGYQLSALGEWRTKTGDAVITGPMYSPDPGKRLVPPAKQFKETVGQPDGGFTYHPTKNSPTTGYVVVVNPENNQRIPAATITTKDILSYAGKHRALAKSNDNIFIGGWHDPKDNLVHLDTPTIIQDRDEAIKIAKSKNERFVYNIGTGELVETVTIEERDAREQRKSATNIRRLQRPGGRLRKYKDSIRASDWPKIDRGRAGGAGSGYTSQLKHYPGDKDHDQSQHGNWATGTVTTGSRDEGVPRKPFQRGSGSGEYAVSAVRFDTEDRSDTGFQLEYAGTGPRAGTERLRYNKDPVTGLTTRDTGEIYFYLPDAEFEPNIVDEATVRHDLELPSKVLVLNSPEFKEYLDRASEQHPLYSPQNLWTVMRQEAMKDGWDAVIDEHRGVGVMWRDIQPHEITKTIDTFDDDEDYSENH